MSIRVALVDDQPLFRSGLKMLIDAEDDLEVVGEADGGRTALDIVRATSPDVVLMDVRMPDGDGIQATETLLRELRDPPRIVILTTFDLDEGAARAIRAGASGFLLKDAEPGFLLAAIRTVHAGSAVVAPSATRDLVEHFGRRAARDDAGLAELSEREREIFLLAARGLSNTEIARREFIGETTVKTHVSRVLAKLGLRDRIQLVVYAYEHGLLG